jgi:DNA-binding beta-propeller fold protein YncE
MSILCLLVAFVMTAARADASLENFDATTEVVGRNASGFETPVNQFVTPAGTLVELPGLRPLALALSPDGKLLVTSGLTHEVVVVDPATGEIRQHVSFPSDRAQEPAPVSTAILSPDEKAQVSFTGLVFSPDGSRIYLSNVNGDIKVFGVQPGYKVVPLFSIPLPPANAPLRTPEIPAGIAVSPDGKKIYVALNLSNREPV